jgi:hypothetical protein
MNMLLSKLIALTLMLLISLQGVAATRMSFCNNLLKTNAEEKNVSSITCHQDAAGAFHTQHNKQDCNDKVACKTACATLCSNLGAMTAIESNIHPLTFLSATISIRILHQSYASITLPSPQRPPISLS